MLAHLRQLAQIAALIGLASCGGGSGDAGTTPTPPIDRNQIVAGARCTGTGLTGWCALPALDIRVVAASACWDGSRCVAVGSRGYVALTTDAGAKWTRVADLPLGPYSLGHVMVADANTVFAATTYGEEFWRSADGGRTWTLASRPQLDLVPSLPTFPSPQFSALDAQTLIVWGGAKGTYVSTDGGTNWRQTAPNIWSVGPDGTLIGSSYQSLSVDLGLTWRPLSTGSLSPQLLARSSAGRSRVRLLVNTDTGLKAWSSDDGGKTSSLVNVQTPVGNSGAYSVWSAVLRPDGTGHALAATDVIFASTTVRVADSAQLWTTQDDGRTWTVAKDLVPGGASQAIDLLTSGFVGDDVFELASVDRLQPTNRVITANRVIDLRSGADIPLAALPAARTSRLKMRIGSSFLAADSTGVWWQSSADGARWASLPDSGPRTTWRSGGVPTLLALDAQRLLAVGMLTAELWRSEDFGRNWSSVTASAGVRGSSLRRLTDGSVLLTASIVPPWLSSDGGSTWRTLQQPAGVSSGSTLFLDRQFGWTQRESCSDTVTCTRELLVTQDGGSSWATVNSITATPRLVGELVQFVDRQRAVKLGASADIAFSTDGGRTWTAAPVTDAAGGPVAVSQSHRVLFDSAGTGWALITVAGQASVLRSADAGRSWVRLTLPAGLPTDLSLADVFSPDGRKVWVVGTGGLILASSDGGSGWRVQPSGTQMPIFAISALDAQTVWLGLADGRILASITGGD